MATTALNVFGLSEKERAAYRLNNEPAAGRAYRAWLRSLPAICA